MKRALWHKHPAVNRDLTFGERAADRLKHHLGSWPFLFVLNAIVAGWIILQVILGHHRFDPYPYILLNLMLSIIAAQQGATLQIAANRGDRIASEVALHTEKTADDLLQVNQQQLVILQRLDGLQEQVAALAEQVRTSSGGKS